MGRRKRKHKGKEEVELNLAAMLDMAFQLLTFFILTFKPAPVEGDIALRMPPPQPVTNPKGEAAGDNESNTNPLAGLETLTISAIPNSKGAVASVAIDQTSVNFSQLDAELKAKLKAGTTIKQVLIQAGSGLRYDALMSVIDVCTHQKLSDGQKLSKLSFVEMPSGAQ